MKEGVSSHAEHVSRRRSRWKQAFRGCGGETMSDRGNRCRLIFGLTAVRFSRFDTSRRIIPSRKARVTIDTSVT